jgi:MoaA/NifB/PqqE/SkfB family radical SAM enzyme
MKWTPRSVQDPGVFAMDSEFMTAPMPKILWIELTSKCPFDCIFCTRRVRFGGGQHLDFEVYRRLIAELEEPDFIGLNYSGESIYYPKLLEAIHLATATGATTEVVSAFSSISPSLLRGIAESGLDRLAISLHTVDPAQYQKIYKFGSIDLLKRRVAELLELKIALGVQKPRLDFCFVAMSENLDQLPAVAEYARSVGARELSIHPIIGRHPVPHDFSQELKANQLREGFKDALRSSVAAVQNTYPTVALNVLNPDLDPHPRLNHTPGYYSPALPTGARIYSCDQSPFESVHVLAGGNVVVCEVHDEVSFGNLHENSLRDIWAGDRYRDFRKRYVLGSVPECRNCVWKLAYLPGPLRSMIVIAEGMTPQLLRGWHGHDGSDLIWSKRNAVLALGNPGRKKRLRIVGALPPPPRGETNSLHLSCNRVPIGSIQNGSAAVTGFDKILNLPHGWDRLYLEISTCHLFRPSLHSSSSDSRDLGAGLSRIEVCD